MRIMIKGGVWKNTEDEILKAAVMKYGKNQWARVASLLNRKSAKQCKARWYEWLDPSIKKTEWTRDEEEKLLHLAKLYPCQWRTVAPLVGRTAAQCMERYERLLDDAEREIAGEGGAEGGGSSEEVRRLRPGEIDPNPEVRPARPDPVDMDEDEKEMLSEARARLANTRGKKAKRKAREAQLDEARRLASLQKKRELKAAGIYTSRFGGRSNKKYMDYDGSPFQKLAPAGFYDVSGEKRADGDRKRSRGDADFEAIRLDRFEEQRRDAAEKIAARDDKKKVQKLMKANLPLAVAQLSALNDPSSVLRRSELALPAPQVTDEELEDIARLGADSDGGGSGPALLASGASGADVVANLLANARARTPARPRTEDAVAQEARNAIADRALQTPLLGEDQADREAGTGYAGATPLTGGRSAFESAYGDAEDLRADRKRARVELKAGLEGLPAPKFAYDVDAPADDDAAEPAARPARTPDAADRDAAEAAAAREAARAELALRSSAVRRDLPRPEGAAPEEIDEAAADLDQAAIEAACYALHRLEKVNLPARLAAAKARCAANDAAESSSRSTPASSGRRRGRGQRSPPLAFR
ncbi:RNA polymerase II transcription regulator recruiting protein [Aureococcus anophagefferens]|nr:RNA polymerase II transcription regulator recruiting protein [Aureococcus anophagefferens]